MLMSSSVTVAENSASSACLVFDAHARLVAAEVGHNILGIFGIACLVFVVQTVFDVYGVLHLGMLQLGRR